MQLEDDSLWQFFPQALETLDGARRYISAFRAPLQELNNLNSNQVHALQACSLLAIPPSMERRPPSGNGIVHKYQWVYIQSARIEVHVQMA